MRGKLESFQYVSILNVLQLILQDDILTNFNHGVATSTNDGDDSILQDYTDGTAFQNHEVFRGNKQILRLHMYTDEFAVVNPLGSKINHCTKCVLSTIFIR